MVTASSCLGRMAKIAGGLLLAAIGIYFVATLNLRSLGVPIGEWPRLPFYVYTTSKVTLTFDGEEIAIEGTTRCKRRFEMDADGDLRPLMFLDHVGFTYKCGPEWFGHRFEDGSALLVGAYSNRSPRLPGTPTMSRGSRFNGDSEIAGIIQIPPAVIWLDSADTPTRAEYYYSMDVLDDPNSRLTSIRRGAEMWPASLWTSIVTGRSPTDSSGQVPSIKKPSDLYRSVGHYAVEVPKDRWGAIQGIKEALAKVSGPSLLRSGEQLTEEQSASLFDILPREAAWLPPRFMHNAAIARHASGSSDTTAADNFSAESSAEASVYPVAPESSSFRRFHFDGSLPRGALKMSVQVGGKMSDPVEFVVRDETASGTYVVMWLGGYLYDPAVDTIYSLRVTTF